MDQIATGAAAKISSEAAKGIFQEAKRHIRYVISYQKYVNNFEDKLQKLIEKRSSVKEEIVVAERNVEKIKPDVRGWCARVDKVIPKVETNKVKELQVKVENGCFFGLCPSIKSRYRLSRIAEEDATTFDDLIKEGQFDRVGYRDVPEATVRTEFVDFDSRKKVFNDIMDSLKDSTVRMIGVYGMPGVGKTSLVREVERQLQEVKLFNSVVRTIVSVSPDVLKIQDQIAESLGLKLEEKSADRRADRLCERLMKEENVLIILDDLWKKLNLEEVGIPFGSQHKGCKILLTSRNKNVLCNEMDATETFLVGDLDDKEAWEFFKKMAGDCVESADLQPTAIEVAKKCARLPLAIATVARALRNKSLFVWRDALLQLQRPYSENSSEISAEVYSAIYLSFNHLSSHDLKQTFLLCSLLRRNTRIEYLLRYAIGLGLIKGVHSLKEGRDRLLTMMSTLKESCMLLDSNTNNQFFDVHDLTYIVAKSIASKDYQLFALQEGDVLTDWPDEESMKNCNKICLNYPSINNLPDQLNCPQLLLFLLCSKDLSLTLLADFFKESTNLKVIGLTGMQFSSLPSSICLLTSLSTLCLHHCKLGDNITFIGELKSLEILSLWNSDIKILPKEIGQLVKLKLLDVSRCAKLIKISDGVLSSLTRLEELHMGGTSLQWGQSNTASLADLHALSHLSTLEVQISDVLDVPHDFFQELQKLERYKIFIGKEWEWEWFHNYQYSRTLKLSLSTSVDDLDRGIKKLLKKTEDLHLDELKGAKIALQELMDEENLSHLKNLYIQNGPDIEYIIKDRSEFPTLQSLALQGLPQLVSFCPQHGTYTINSLPQHDLPLFNEKISFPYLKKLWLKSINVTRIWHNQLSTTSFCTYEKLTTLKIEGCGSLKHLLSFSMAKCLVHLIDFEITGCNCLKEIIFMEETKEEIEATMTSSLFPQLKFLKLKDLYQLIGFYSNSQTQVIEFLAMKSLRIDNCPELESFISRSSMEDNQPISSHVLFDNKVAFPSLEEMSISYLIKMKMIWENPLPPKSFPKLQQLTVERCDELLTIFPSNMLTNFQGLQILRIQNCASLEQVFEAELGSFNIHEEILEITREEKEAALLVTSQLREFRISQLPKLKYIWKNDPKGIFSFKNLCQIFVSWCRSLKNIFPASVARDLPKLCDLRIRGCRVEEIVSKVEEGSDLETTVTFEFDQLSFLQLCYLKECKWFYPGMHTTKWPMLKELKANECGEMKIFGTQLITHNQQLDSSPPLFLIEKVFPKLQRLTLGGDYIAMISGGQFSSSLFHKIKAFKVDGNIPKSVGFQISFLERFNNLEELCISHREFEKLFCTDGDAGDKGTYTGTLSTIRKLELTIHRNLKDRLWKLDVQVGHILPNLETLQVKFCYNLMSLGSSSASFQKLTTLKVWYCNGMEYLDTCLAIQGLSQLKKLIIEECNSLKEIVGSEEDETTCEVNFSRLESMELVSLRQLKGFCLVNHTFGFPCLEEVIVRGCPELEIFCKGVLNAPSLQSVEYEKGKRHWSGDLNSTVQHLHSTKVGYQGIEHLVLSECSKSIEIWKEKSLNFKNLWVLEVEECNSLKYICSVSMALELVQLRELKVKNCPMVEKIIKTGEEETEMNTVWLPKLWRIKLESCSELKSFCMGSVTLQCPSLTTIDVEDCPKMYAMASPREVGGGEKTPFFNDKVLCGHLEILIVKGCRNLEYIFPSFLIKNFVGLSHLSLLDCENIEEVIFKDESAAAAVEGITETYRFTELKGMKLIRLPKLGRFCHGYSSETESPPLFNERVAFPSLKHLTIEGIGKCRKIWHDKLTMNSFCELAFLRVADCERLSNILPFNMVGKLEKLKTLTIEECKSVQEIIGPDGDQARNSNESHTVTSAELIELESTIKFVLPKVRELNLRMLPKLKKEVSLAQVLCNLEFLQVMQCRKLKNLLPISVSLKHLTTLKVSKCHGFRNLLTLTIAKSMVQLKTMSVTDCQMIEEIVASTTDEVMDVTVFNQLESLELDSLPCLSRFWSGNYALVFPTLEDVIIRQCPKMEFFTMGELKTPMLHGFQSTKGKYIGCWESDLNATIQQLFIEKVFPSSEDLELSSINNQRAWNHKLLATNSYAQNLTCLTIDGYHKVNYLFSSSMVKSFVQLKKLNIENCENVESVIVVKGSAQKETMNQKLFRVLEFLVLKDLPKLTRFCHGNYFEFPLLTTLSIESCPTLKTLSPVHKESTQR